MEIASEREKPNFPHSFFFLNKQLKWTNNSENRTKKRSNKFLLQTKNKYNQQKTNDN